MTTLLMAIGALGFIPIMELISKRVQYYTGEEEEQ